jgi:hypothetical protein
LDSSGRSSRWSIQAPNTLATERQQLTAAEVLRLIRGLPQQRPSQVSLARRYNVEFRTVDIDGLPGRYVVLRADPRRFAFYLWPNISGVYYFSPFEFADVGFSPFRASDTEALRITEETHPGLPRLEWKYLHSAGFDVRFYLVEVIDTAV